MSTDEDKELTQIVAEITEDVFRITRCKVGEDDPIVAAALVQSRLMRRTAGEIAEILRRDTGLDARAEAIKKNADDLRGVIASMGRQIDAYASECASAQASKAQLSIGQAAQLAASRAVEGAVGQRLNDLATRLESAGPALDAATSRASREVNRSFADWCVALGSVLIAAVVLSVSVAHWLDRSAPPVGVASLTQQQKADMDGGRTIRLIYNSLTPQEQAHISKLAQALPAEQQ